MIRAVIFDFGNVISIPQTGEWYTVMEQKTGIPAAVFASSFEKYRVPFDRGDITGADMYAGILRDNGYEDFARDRALCQKIADTDLESWRNCDDNVTEWGLTLKKNGYKLGILSNMPHEFLDKYESSIRLFKEADAPVFSCREKLVKPEKAIYVRTLERLGGIRPGEAVFFDDLPENIEAAVALGIHGFVWTGLDQAKKDFARAAAAG